MSKIKFIVFDFDGVFSNGQFYFDNEENVKKTYNAKDAYSLKIIKDYNIKCGIITNDKVISIKHAPHIFNRLDKVSLGSDKSKLDIIDIWLNEYKYSYKEVAYIGDDLPDIPVLKKVGFSACPNDAVEEVKEVSQYVCKNKGGYGAVREFVDLIIKKNISKTETIKHNEKINNDGKITAVIPVRKGSTRCKNKNIRNFGDTNLLKLKIETLKKIENIEEIIVSTDCNNMAKLAKELNVKVHIRDEYYASSECPNYEYWSNIAKNVGQYHNFMMVNAVSPLIDSNKINEFIKTFRENNYKNMVTVNKQKRFFCNSITNDGINFDDTQVPNSQNLTPLAEITFGLCIALRKDIIESKCIYGKNPHFFNLDDISSLDIDENSDFLTAELLYKNNILNENICQMILEKRTDKILLLDCTIRDGGYLNNWEFSDDEVLDCYQAVTEAGYDYFEIGFRTNKESLLNKGKWCYSTEDNINTIYQKYNGCKIAVMAKVGTVTIEDFVKKNESNITMVRVLLARATIEDGIQKSYYNQKEIKKAKHFCQQLIEYGYEVCMNFGCGDIINEDEIKIIASEFHDVKIRALYLADTYGGFNSNNLPIQLHKFYTEFNKFNSKISFGFHSHNNNEDALNKTITAIYHGCTIIDSCIGGLGRGAGNLKSEQLITHLYKNNSEYITKISPLIFYYDEHILSKTEYCKNSCIQSHPFFMISSVLSLHPNYINDILKMNTTIEQDIKLILKIDKYTKKNNERNYNKKLLL